MNDLWTYHTVSMQWLEIKTFGAVPSHRSNSSFHYDHINNRIIMFGGGGSNKTRFNSIHFLDWNTKIWTEVAIKGTLIFKPRKRVLPLVENLPFFITPLSLLDRLRRWRSCWPRWSLGFRSLEIKMDLAFHQWIKALWKKVSFFMSCRKSILCHCWLLLQI